MRRVKEMAIENESTKTGLDWTGLRAAVAEIVTQKYVSQIGR